ncbi:hypothetical protein GZ998_05405 [Actinomyces sp. 594]|uniref:hypothetical protein n=1 Tax=Actinomyces sp. 594 TaxID=2057793 RepID=UPI001C588335|nr:hypothetical protein [Actinomyces sp. 594]MBW3068949.1 hypothetical protein [Actinomyces sp. 594]
MGVSEERAALLAAVDAGVLDVPDVIAAGHSRAAAGIKVRRLLACAGMSPSRVRRLLGRARGLHGGTADPTVGWLVDPRAGGRRVAAFAAAWEPRPGTWEGFPFTPAPADWRRADP